MKFWNKHPEVRRRHWTMVELPRDTDADKMYPPGVTPFAGWYRRGPFEKMKRELQHTPGKGKFYMMILNKEIWFENAADAAWFLLRL